MGQDNIIDAGECIYKALLGPSAVCILFQDKPELSGVELANSFSPCGVVPCFRTILRYDNIVR